MNSQIRTYLFTVSAILLLGGSCFVFNSMVRCALSICCWCGRYYGLLSDGIGSWFGLPAETFASLQCLVRSFNDCRICFYV